MNTQTNQRSFSKNILTEITAEAPINIAIIKYWGKQDSEQNIPLNDSISLTLSSDCMKSNTTVKFNDSLVEDRLILNGIKYPINKRVERVLKFVRHVKKTQEKDDKKKTLLKSQEWILDCKVEIISRNNFPTAAGLASSASGYAALGKALHYLYFGQFESSSSKIVKGNKKHNQFISHIARIGSGSACRSVDGGFVKWLQNNGKNSHAIQLQNESYWADLRVIICVASHHRKKVSSAEGQQRSKVKFSSYYISFLFCCFFCVCLVV